MYMYALAAALSGCGWNTGNGEKVGTVIKIAQQGMWHKTWEAEIVRGGMVNGSGGFSTTPLHLTISDGDTGNLQRLQDAFDKQYEVKVKYVTYMFAPWASDTENHFAVSVEPLSKNCP